ncbi:MAG: MarR family transcriptional regulator [Desulfotignum sp.]|nr:MarR family transcriptional regulator [Desulfotignum sp.]
MSQTNYRNDLTLNEKVLMAIVRAAENFKRTHSTIFKQYGLSFPQYNILRVLESSHKGQNKISTVGKIMLVPGANMTGLAKRLEQKGFIVRRPDPADERVTLLKITPKGKQTLARIKDRKDTNIEQILEDFTLEDKTALLDKIKQLIAATAGVNESVP